MLSYKVKDHFQMTNIADESIVIPRGPYALEFNGILVLNETCAILWDFLRQFRTKDELCAELIRLYGIDSSVAKKDIERCINKMLEFDLLDVEE